MNLTGTISANPYLSDKTRGGIAQIDEENGNSLITQYRNLTLTKNDPPEP